MPLAKELVAHRDRVLADLTEDHDDFVRTKTVWRIVQQHINAGETRSIASGIRHFAIPQTGLFLVMETG